MTHRWPGFSMEPSIMLGIVPSAPALNRLAAILMTFIRYIRDVRAQPWRQGWSNGNGNHKRLVVGLCGGGRCLGCFAFCMESMPSRSRKSCLIMQQIFETRKPLKINGVVL